MVVDIATGCSIMEQLELKNSVAPFSWTLETEWKPDPSFEMMKVNLLSIILSLQLITRLEHENRLDKAGYFGLSPEIF